MVRERFDMVDMKLGNREDLCDLIPMNKEKG